MPEPTPSSTSSSLGKVYFTRYCSRKKGIQLDRAAIRRRADIETSQNLVLESSEKELLPCERARFLDMRERVSEALG